MVSLEHAQPMAAGSRVTCRSIKGFWRDGPWNASGCIAHAGAQGPPAACRPQTEIRSCCCDAPSHLSSPYPLMPQVRALQVWRHALQFAAEVTLDGLAHAGQKGRCTMMGRAAMSLDLQAVTGGLQSIMAGGTRNPATAAFVADNMRLVDNYIKVRQCRGGPDNEQELGSTSASNICWVDEEHSTCA